MRVAFIGVAYVSDHAGSVTLDTGGLNGHVQYTLKDVPQDKIEEVKRSAQDNFHAIECLIEENGLNRKTAMELAALLYNLGLRVNKKKQELILQRHKGTTLTPARSSLP